MVIAAAAQLAYIKSTKHIAKGDEIFINYHDDGVQVDKSLDSDNELEFMDSQMDEEEEDDSSQYTPSQSCT